LPYALLTLANAQAAYGHLDNAAETCAFLLQIEPDANARTTMGLIDLNRGKLAEAEQSLLKALELDPQFAAAHSNLGMVYQAWDRDKAREAFLTALKIDPMLATARQNLRHLENLEKSQPVTDEGVISRFKRLHFYLLGVILFARVTNSFLPEAVNLFLPSYRPKGFYGGLNAVFAISMIVWIISFCRRGERVSRFATRLKTGIALNLIFHWLVQLSVATFYLMVDADVNPYIGIALMVVIAMEWLVLWLRMRVEARVED
jgi:tetratricopeptide (TPR) repeat protein